MVLDVQNGSLRLSTPENQSGKNNHTAIISVRLCTSKRNLISVASVPRSSILCDFQPFVVQRHMYPVVVNQHSQSQSERD